MSIVHFIAKGPVHAGERRRVRLLPAQPGPRTAMTPHPTAYHVSLSFTRIAYMCGPEPIQFSSLESGS